MHKKTKIILERRRLEMKRDGTYSNELLKCEELFFEHVWGPVSDFRFDKLYVNHLFWSEQMNEPITRFVYDPFDIKLLVEIIGHHDCFPYEAVGNPQDYWSSMNDLILQGWLVLRFSKHQIESQPLHCQNQIKLALQPAEIPSLPPFSHRETDIWDVWEIRKQLVIQMAKRHNGKVKAREVAAECNVSIRAAAAWLKRLAVEGLLSFAGGHPRGMVYFLKDG
ncbi:hypothetical protein GK047_13930 [Paenibacillus sp. SYP-B3998]|uniref:Uncharacterized protein n=1 Tax=Paenibacillus sp. SYP-B3998 TaxID=2678564 RepID=A0A6G4A0D1_9BACL|nr:helix-turn-helix domain-containing protein [Paenibacillus sp. SYP-B3998]NEW07107.1 hypothetical protein [Paenibacillus sp. SYP-B3998]